MDRSELRLQIREELREFYDTDTVGTGGIDSSATTLPVNSIDRYKPGDTLQVESEQMRVVTFDSTALTLTVVRNTKLTSAAAHIAGTAISIISELTDRQINYAINSAIAETYANRDRGDMGIWYNVVDTTLTTSISTREYTIPAGFANTHFIVEVRDGDGNYHIVNNWRISGVSIVFNQDFDEAGQTIRISGMGYQSLLSDDTTDLTLADEQAEFIVAHAAYRLIETRLGPRIKATEYSASVNDRAGQPLEMIQLVRHLRDRAEGIKARESRPMKSGYMSRPAR
jgi:hypothetical protein